MSVAAGDTAVTITGLTPRLTYNVTIVALSDHLPSPVVGAVTVALGEPHKCLLKLKLIYQHCCGMYLSILLYQGFMVDWGVGGGGMQREHVHISAPTRIL